MIKIAVSGTHGVGKSTCLLSLAGRLKEEGYIVEIVSESARECPFHLNERSDALTQLWILAKQIESEAHAIKRNPDVILVDRAISDTFVYSQHLTQTGLIEAGPEYEIIKSTVDIWQKTYDVIFLIRENGIVLQADGVRSVDREFQERIDVLMSEQYKKSDQCLHISGLNGERVSTMMRLVVELLDAKRKNIKLGAGLLLADPVHSNNWVPHARS